LTGIAIVIGGTKHHIASGDDSLALHLSILYHFNKYIYLSLVQKSRSWALKVKSAGGYQVTLLTKT